MTITTRISLKQYVKLMFMLAYRKPVLILLVIFNVLMISWVVAYFMEWLPLPQPEYPQYVAIFIITLVQPLLFYYTVRTNYKSSARLSGEITLTFSREQLKMKGHMFSFELSWHKAYQLVETKNWFLIYENTLAAILIHKSDLSRQELKDFKALLKTIPDLDKKLREE